MRKHLYKVRDFHLAMGLPIRRNPCLIPPEEFALNLRLWTEEISEYCEAVGEGDIVKIADALGDIVYVVYGAAVRHGIPLDDVFSQIHASNMTKQGGGLDKTGKLIKPLWYKPVDLEWLRG